MANFDFNDILLLELADMYSAENQLIEHLPKVAAAASSDNLKEAIKDHLNETKKQAKRLEKIFNLLEVKPREKKCEAMKALLEEGDELVKKIPKSVLRDAALIGAAQKIEHYEIAAYGTIYSHAKHLGASREILNLINDNLQEEGTANKKLTEIADGTFFTSGVNHEAVEEVLASSSRRK